MIHVTDTDVGGHEHRVTVVVDGVKVEIKECLNTGEIVVDLSVGEVPVACLFKGQYIRKMVTFKNACDYNAIDREVKP